MTKAYQLRISPPTASLGDAVEGTGRVVDAIHPVIAEFDTQERAHLDFQRLEDNGESALVELPTAATKAHPDTGNENQCDIDVIIKYWIKIGAIGGCGFGFLFVPAPFSTPLNLDSSLGPWILAVIEGAVIFTGIIASGFSLLKGRSPLSSLVLFEATLKTDEFHPIVHGTLGLTTEARHIFKSTALRSLEWVD